MSPNLSNYMIILAAVILLVISEARAYSRKTRNLEDVLSGEGNINVLINKHLFSMAALGIAVLFSILLLNHKGIWLLPEGDYGWFSVWSLSALAAFFTGFFAARGKIPGLYKLTSVTIPSQGLIASYFVIRFLFLVIYEFFFRGVMLQSVAVSAGIEWAIVINLVLYAIAHIYSNRKEFIGSVPFGLLLCLITIKLQSVWPAIVIHLMLSLPYELKIAYLYSRSVKRIKA